MAKKASPDVEIYCSIEKDIPELKAILINDGKRKIWVPRSLIRLREQEAEVRGVQYWTITIPEWLAFEKELI